MTASSPFRSKQSIPDRLRIALTSYRSDPYVGGQGVYLRHMSKALVDAGHKVDVISAPPWPMLDKKVNLIKLPSLDLYANPHPIRALRLRWLWEPINLFEWWSHNSGGFPEPYTFGLRLARYLKSHAKDYDILLDNQTLCPSLLPIAQNGLPVICTLHHPITRDKAIDIAHAKSPIYKFLKWRWYAFLRMQIRTARQLPCLIAVSQNTRCDAQKEFQLKSEQLQLVYHGIDSQTFHPKPNLTKATPMYLVSTASADVPLKGLIYLIRAFVQLLPQWPQLRLKIIGRLRPGQTARELKRWGIAHSVEFLHDLTPAQMCDLYNRATIGVCPSVYEGFGFPAGEMMASGLPVVATNGGSLPEVVGDAGLIVPHSNPTALAEAIARLLVDAPAREALGKKARQHIVKTFQWADAAQHMVRHFRTQIAQQQPNRYLSQPHVRPKPA